MGKKGISYPKVSASAKDINYSRQSSSSSHSPHGGEAVSNASKVEGEYTKGGGVLYGKRQTLVWGNLKMLGFVLCLIICFFLVDSAMLSAIQYFRFESGMDFPRPPLGSQDESNEATIQRNEDRIQMTQRTMYGRLMNLAFRAHEKDQLRYEPHALWKEPNKQASLWKPCADKDTSLNSGLVTGRTGFISVSANGGLNQQRVAVCNAVVVAALLNATLVIPKFLYSSVWKDSSQFGDIYQEDYFVNFLKNDVHIVKELPPEFDSVDLEALGSQITDTDLPKESKPNQFIKHVLPLLRRNGAVHFLGFGNRLAFDPFPTDLQRLRCKCNFHALKFVPKIQQAGSLLVKRIRKHEFSTTKLDETLFGNRLPEDSLMPKGADLSSRPLKYLALHMRFEMDMVAYSRCDFGGGEREREELQAYREIHFPLLVQKMKNESISPSELRQMGKCPLSPEEAALVLSALGYRSQTYIYLAGSQIYGGQSRLLPFTKLYPNLVTKEDILSPSDLAPFLNYSSQLAALDFMVCAAADVFAITDSGSQLSSLVSGYRIYHGEGHAPTLRPGKRRLAKILAENGTIRWSEFAGRVAKMIQEDQRVSARSWGRSIYRIPRSQGCMCNSP